MERLDFMFGIGQVEAASARMLVGRDAGLSSSFPHEPNNQSAYWAYEFLGERGQQLNYDGAAGWELLKGGGRCRGRLLFFGGGGAGVRGASAYCFFRHLLRPEGATID